MIMLFTYRALDDEETRVEEATARIRDNLRRYVAAEPRRWTGLLARMTRARALAGSNSVEGINVSEEDAIAAIDREDPSTTDRDTWLAVVGYREAMDYILQRRQSESFRITEDVLLAVHFMICRSDLAANPGQYRPGWVGVRNSRTGELVHEGVDRDRLEALVHEVLDYVNDAPVESVFLRAAMTHLNLAMLHPFTDGNGRTARCIQTAVLASDGIVAPEFSSIEEYIGRNQQAYYDVLAEVGGGAWDPMRNAKPWVRFCLSGHYVQAATILRRMQEVERIYGELSELVEAHGFPDRTSMALLQAALGSKVRNSSYRVSADVSKNLASRDLKMLVDAELLVPEGEKRGRAYGPAPVVVAIRQRLRLSRRIEDPFADGRVAQPRQESLFPETA
ncbi:MAG: Fic family protein [Rhodospirillales bacterium]|nr:Fic family protein [Rhodospirillales bacterium]